MIKNRKTACLRRRWDNGERMIADRNTADREGSKNGGRRPARSSVSFVFFCLSFLSAKIRQWFVRRVAKRSNRWDERSERRVWPYEGPGGTRTSSCPTSVIRSTFLNSSSSAITVSVSHQISRVINHPYIWNYGNVNFKWDKYSLMSEDDNLRLPPGFHWSNANFANKWRLVLWENCKQILYDSLLRLYLRKFKREIYSRGKVVGPIIFFRLDFNGNYLF